MEKRIVKGILTKEQMAAGTYLVQDDHAVYLMKQEKCLAVFSATGATVLDIRKEADQILEWTRSGITFERTS